MEVKKFRESIHLSCKKGAIDAILMLLCSGDFLLWAQKSFGACKFQGKHTSLAYKHKLRIFYAQSSIFFQNPACKKSLRSEPSVFGTPLKIFRFKIESWEEKY